MAYAIRTKGIFGPGGLVQAASRANKELNREVRGALRKAGDIVKTGSTSRLEQLKPNDRRTAEGFKTRVRQRGVSVEQSIGRTTGDHPEWGAFQMRRVLVPELEDKEDDVEREMENAIDKVADHFERR